MKKPKILKLRIIKCPSYRCWYRNCIGKTYYFLDDIFLDDEDIASLWILNDSKATAGERLDMGEYVYLDDLNYNIVIRKNKLKKISNVSDAGKFYDGYFNE